MGKFDKNSSGHGRGNNREMKRKHFKQQMKFSGNKNEGQGFAERRKKKVLQQYKKVSTKDDKTTKLMKEKLKQIYEMDSAEVKEEEKGEVAGTKPSTYHKAEMEVKSKNYEAEREKKKSDEDKETREAALKQYKKKKKKNYRNMSKVNYKGQPNMASRMDMLLEKIKKPNS